MNPHDETDEALTPEERALFDALPREREPGRLLEERTVRALREAGLVRPAAPAVASPAARRLRFPAAWISGAMAAGLALFLGGLATGQYLGQKNATALVTDMRRQDAQQAALMVQQTGSAYVQALSRLATVSDTSRGAQAQQGRQAASTLLRAAADEVVRMSPNDPVASGILAAFDRAKVQQQAQQPARTDGTKQSVVWF
jgi:hypothetical protein